MTGLDQDMMQRNLVPLAPGFADQHRDYGLQPDGCDPAFLVLGVLLYLYAEHAGLPMPEKGDQLFAVVAVNGGLPLIVGIMFVVGLISSTYSSAGAAMTALTTSFTVDILRGPEALGRRAVDAGTYRGARRNGTRDGVCGSLFRPVR